MTPQSGDVGATNRMRDIIVIGASAGGITSLRELLAHLSPEVRAALFVVQHVAPDSPGMLPRILSKVARIPVLQAQDSSQVRYGVVHVAPPDRHLILQDDHVRVVKGPRENRHRPSIDVLFRSAATTHRTRVIGVVLSGMLDDGSAGLEAIRQCGGVTVVQHPAEALYPDMPLNALQRVQVDHCTTLRDLPELLMRLAAEPASDPAHFPVPQTLLMENEFMTRAITIDEMDILGERCPMSCPSCAGPLWRMNGEPKRFRCHTGHAFSMTSMLQAQDDEIEDSIDGAFRTIREKAALLQDIAEQHRDLEPAEQRKYRHQAADLERRAELLNAVREAIEVGDTR